VAWESLLAIDHFLRDVWSLKILEILTNINTIQIPQPVKINEPVLF
jgi:hypothetical protein